MPPPSAGSAKRAFVLHGRVGAWLAWPLALVMTTGVLAIYAPEMDAALYPAAACEGSERGRIDVAWSSLAASAARAVAGARVITISAPESDGASAWALVEVGPRDYRHVYLDPHDGRARGIAPFRTPHRVLRDLHRDWLLGENVGLTLVTTFALVLAVSTVTGLRFWSRRSTGSLGRRYHRIASVLLLPFVAVVVVTAVWYWAENLFGFFELRPSGEIPAIGPADVDRVRAHAETLPIDALVAAARHAYPELEIHLVAMPTARRPVFSVAGHADEDGLVRELANQVFVHPFEGRVLAVHRARDLGPLAWWEHVVDAIHFGTWGGPWSRAAWLALGVATGLLPLTGWFARRARARGVSSTVR